MAAVLRLFHLGRQSLWIDEVFTWYSAGAGGRLALRELLQDIHGPLFSLLLHAWIRIAGDGEWALRLPSALFGIAMIPALAWASSRWLGRETAIPAAWLAAGSPFLVWYSQEARNYSLLMLCACLSVVSALALARRIDAGRAIVFLASVGAGALSNLSFLLLGPLHFKWLLGEPGVRPRRLVLLVSLAIGIALIVLPWVPQIRKTWDWHRLRLGGAPSSAAIPLRGATTFHPGAVPFALHTFTVGYTLGPSLRELRSSVAAETLRRHAPELVTAAGVFSLLGVLGLIALRRRRRLLDLALWFGVPALAVSYSALQNFKVFHPRYLAVAEPGLLMAMAAAFADAKPRTRLALGLAVALLWGTSLAHHYFDPAYGKEDYRSAGELLRARGAAGEEVLTVGADEPMFYYYRGPLPQHRFWLGFAADPARLERRLDEALAAATGAWIVLSRPEDLDPWGRFAALVDRRFPEAERFAFVGVRVWHLKRGTASSAVP